MISVVKRVILLVVVGLCFGFVIGKVVVYFNDRAFFKHFRSQQMESGPWAYGSAEDAIKIAQPLKEDPNLKKCAVYVGPNEDSWIIDEETPRIVKFRGVQLIYNSYKDYEIFKKWLKDNPFEPNPSEQTRPTWK